MFTIEALFSMFLYKSIENDRSVIKGLPIILELLILLPCQLSQVQSCAQLTTAPQSIVLHHRIIDQLELIASQSIVCKPWSFLLKLRRSPNY